MGLEARKTEKESSQSLIRRFTRRVQRSGILRVARKIRFHQRSKSKGIRKRAALRREQLKKEYEQLKKMGKELK